MLIGLCLGRMLDGRAKGVEHLNRDIRDLVAADIDLEEVEHLVFHLVHALESSCWILCQ